LLEFRTGAGLSFDVIVDRGFDIGRCELGSVPVAFASPVGVEGPWYYEPEGLGFLRGFGGGLFTTAGLDHTLFPVEDTAAQYHYPPKPTERYPLHGRISNRPARLIAYGEEWEGDQCRLFAEGEVLQSTLFGEQLLLRRRIETLLGEASLRVTDTVENVGFHRTPHMLLYHVNVGFPIVDEGSQVLLPAGHVRALGDYGTNAYQILEAPQPDCVERVFEHTLSSEADGSVPVGIVNRRRGVGLSLVFPRSVLPHFFLWRMLGEGTYVVGLEPSTNGATGRLDARARGELIELSPGEHRSYRLEFRVLRTIAELDEFQSRVEGVAASH